MLGEASPLTMKSVKCFLIQFLCANEITHMHLNVLYQSSKDIHCNQCVCVCVCVCVCIILLAPSTMDTHQKNHCVSVDTHTHTNHGRPRLSETRHSVATGTGMHVNKNVQWWTYVWVGGSPWLDSTHSHTHTHRQKGALCNVEKGTNDAHADNITNVLMKRPCRHKVSFYMLSVIWGELNKTSPSIIKK